MEVLRAIKERRSFRKFKDKIVPHEMLISLLDAARWAPSSGNLQSWEFIIVEDPEIKHKLAEASLKQMFVKDASAIIVVCVDTERCALKYGLRGKHLYSILEGGAAIQNILLAAEELGLASCWVSAFDETTVRNILEVPDPVLPLAIIPIGFSDEFPKAPPRVDLSHISHHDKYGHMEEVRGTAHYDLHSIAETDAKKLIEQREKELITDVDQNSNQPVVVAPKMRKRKKGNPFMRIFE